MVTYLLTLAPKRPAVKGVISSVLGGIMAFGLLVCTNPVLAGQALADETGPGAQWAIEAANRWRTGDQSDGRDKIVAAAHVLHEQALAENAQAQFALAQLLEDGLPRYGGGMAVRYPAQAMGWYVRAAQQGHEGAIKRLKQLVGPDFEVALKPRAAKTVPEEAQDVAAPSDDPEWLEKLRD